MTDRINLPTAAAPLRLGHVHLKVRDAGRSAAFYRRLTGLAEAERVGDRFVFLAAPDGGLHHALAVQSGGTGLYHTAFEAADAAALAATAERLTALGVPFAAVDHGISWALYFDDPDGNGVEVYLDRRAAPGGVGRSVGPAVPRGTGPQGGGDGSGSVAAAVRPPVVIGPRLKPRQRHPP